jgi:hypothetical protein
VLILVAAGVLVRFDGSVEVVEGGSFDASTVTTRGSGWLHPDRLERVNFTQGPFEVHYLFGLQRDTTHSRVVVNQPDGISYCGAMLTAVRRSVQSTSRRSRISTGNRSTTGPRRPANC